MIARRVVLTVAALHAVEAVASGRTLLFTHRPDPAGRTRALTDGDVAVTAVLTHARVATVDAVLAVGAHCRKIDVIVKVVTLNLL